MTHDTEVLNVRTKVLETKTEVRLPGEFTVELEIPRASPLAVSIPKDLLSVEGNQRHVVHSLLVEEFGGEPTPDELRKVSQDVSLRLQQVLNRVGRDLHLISQGEQPLEDEYKVFDRRKGTFVGHVACLVLLMQLENSGLLGASAGPVPVKVDGKRGEEDYRRVNLPTKESVVRDHILAFVTREVGENEAVYGLTLMPVEKWQALYTSSNPRG